MNVRHPPGRAGRIWLGSRLAVARRSAELLDRRRLLLAEELARRERTARETGEAWTVSCRRAELWTGRARVAAGEEQIGVATAHAGEPASARVRWTSVLGVPCAAEPDVSLPDPRRAGALGGTAAFDEAALAVRDAVSAGVRHAAALQARDAVARELLAGARRLRVIEHRWIPRLETALAEVEVRLDEIEREDHVRLRWVRRRIA